MTPIGNRTHDLPACSVLLQQTAPQLTTGKQNKNNHAARNYPNLFDLRKNEL